MKHAEVLQVVETKRDLSRDSQDLMRHPGVMKVLKWMARHAGGGLGDSMDHACVSQVLKEIDRDSEGSLEDLMVAHAVKLGVLTKIKSGVADLVVKFLYRGMFLDTHLLLLQNQWPSLGEAHR